jgi:molybdopterin converting factor small subunit
VKILAFAQTADALGFREREVSCAKTDTPREIVGRIAPDLDWEKLRVALDQEYADWHQPVGAAQELAIIPPVSGG